MKNCESLKKNEIKRMNYVINDEGEELQMMWRCLIHKDMPVVIHTAERDRLMGKMP